MFGIVTQRSFINSKNKSGPKTKPCGTPDAVSHITEEYRLKATNNFLFMNVGKLWHLLKIQNSQFNY